MSSHQNSAYDGETMFHLPARTLNGPRHTKGVGGSNPRAQEFSSSRAPFKAVRIDRPPDEIWGKYNNYRSNGVAISAVIHVAVIGLLLSGFSVSHQITQRQVAQTRNGIGEGRQLNSIRRIKPIPNERFRFRVGAAWVSA